MTHAEMVEEVVKLHEWVKHWMDRAEAAEKALAEAAEDTALLDWLDKNPRRVAHAAGYRGDGDTWVWRDAIWASFDAETLRAAIRAARGRK